MARDPSRPARPSLLRRLVQAVRGAPTKAPLDRIRQRVLHTLHDCEGVQVNRLRFRVATSQNAMDLWLLRGKLYECIAKAHSQSEAARRLQQLEPIFHGWVSISRLNRH